MTRTVARFVAGLLAVHLLTLGSPLVAQSEATRGASPGAHYFTDVELVDQHGTNLRLYSDLLRDHVVIVTAFFSTCTGVCPVMTASLKTLQARLGAALGEEVLILSLTVDPEVDSPARLRAYAQSIGAGEGWHLLSGEPAKVELALRKLGQWVENKEAHGSVWMIGNERTGLWKKVFGLAPVDEIATIVEGVLNDPLGPVD